MSLPEVLLILAAGFAAGGMNALAGGGTFFSFPALLAIGLPPVTANATNAVALWPASLAGAWAARPSLRGLGSYLTPLLLVGLVGGAAGGLLLLLSGDDLFSNLIPWLLLVATLLFAASPWLSRWLASRRRRRRSAAPAQRVRPVQPPDSLAPAGRRPAVRRQPLAERLAGQPATRRRAGSPHTPGLRRPQPGVHLRGLFRCRHGHPATGR